MHEIPDIVRAYLDAHDRRDTEAALGSFTSDAIVKDDGREYRGLPEIRDWLSRASVEFTYTRTLIDSAEVDANTWLVENHLEGDFPGGVIDLRYRFILDAGLISELDIAP
jgi:hypothetical protein